MAGSIGAIAAFCLGLGLLWARGRLPRWISPQTSPAPAKIFLFEGTELVDASPEAERLLGLARAGRNDWERMLSALASHFPDLPTKLDRLDDEGTITMQSADDAEHLAASAIGDRIRLVLTSLDGDGSRLMTEPLVSRSMLREMETLRRAIDGMPFLVWRQSTGGQIVWSNEAYRQVSSESGKQDGPGNWPQRSLFDLQSLSEIANSGSARRLTLQATGTNAPVAYECRATPIEDGFLFSAVCIDATVDAENQLRDFIQTLTKTFSYLATGLAIFDRQRRLIIFNPALTDLTGLPVDFLTTRPSLYSVLDRLRDRRMLPEPKDYGSWRRQIARLETASLDGTYSETWSLPDNRTYRVTGRPHHGGAMALLIEDISSEISLTRRFRSEIELGQAVVDALDLAIAVFSPTGQLSMTNSAYQVLWNTDIGDTVQLPTVTEMSRKWKARAASPIWGEIREFIMHERERTAWEANVTLQNGSCLNCRVAPLSGGATLVSFQLTEAVDTTGQAARKAG